VCPYSAGIKSASRKFRAHGLRRVAAVPVSSPPPVSDRAAFSLLLCSAVQLTGLWSELPPELVSHWADSLTWIMQMTLSSSLTKWMTFIVPWRFLRQQRRNSAYMTLYLGRRRRSRIWVRLNLHLAYQFARPLAGRSNRIYIGLSWDLFNLLRAGVNQTLSGAGIYILAVNMHSMKKVLRQTRLQLQTKLRLYQTCILSISLYGSETWTLLQEDLRKLEVFHMCSSGYAGTTLSETQKLSTGPAFLVFGMSSPGDETHCSAMW